MPDEVEAQSAALATGIIGVLVSMNITPAASRRRANRCLMDVNIVSLLKLNNGRPIEDGART